jgi:hypothetical protein
MAPHKGNKFGTKIKDPTLRQEAFRDYCEHIAAGIPKKAWCFRKDGRTLTYQTIELYIRENPNEFDSNLVDAAEADAFKKLYLEGKDIMFGKYKNASPMTWQVIMRNVNRKHGWDSESLDLSHKLEKFAELKNFFLASGFSAPHVHNDD